MNGTVAVTIAEEATSRGPSEPNRPFDSLPLIRGHSITHALFNQPQTHARLFEDRVFGHTEWRQHRNAAWRHRAEPVLCFRVALGFAWQLLYVAVLSVLVGLLHLALGPKRDGFLSGAHLTSAFSMITFALSLLLVFRTNSSFSRWWEGRVIWGQIVNFGRNYSRQALMWFPPGQEHEPLRAAALRWAAAAPHVLKAHIRDKADPYGEAARLLLDEETVWLRQWGNAPLGVGTALGRLVTAARLEPQLQAEMQRQVELYTNMAGGCERIFKTPIPAAYTRHTSRFLMLYLTATPFLLWSSTGWGTPLVAGAIAFLLLGVENIGVQLEEPFRVLPLDDISRAIEDNIKQLQRHFGGSGDVIAAAGVPIAAATTADRSLRAPGVQLQLSRRASSAQEPALGNLDLPHAHDRSHRGPLRPATADGASEA